MVSQVTPFLVTVIYLMATLPCCQAQCQAGEEEKATTVECDRNPDRSFTCSEEGGTFVPTNVLTVRPIPLYLPLCAFSTDNSEDGRLDGISLFDPGCNKANITYCVSAPPSGDEGTCDDDDDDDVGDDNDDSGGDGDVNGPCNGNETAVTTDVKCVIDAQTMEGSCLGPGDTLVPQEARAFQALSALPSTRTDGCFYNFPDANTVTARSPSATECYARITSCVAG